MLLLRRQASSLLAFGVFSALVYGGISVAAPSMANPIGKVASLFNPNLVKMEDRVEFLNWQLMSLAAHNQNPPEVRNWCQGSTLRAQGSAALTDCRSWQGLPYRFAFPRPIARGLLQRRKPVSQEVQHRVLEVGGFLRTPDTL